MTSRSGLVTSKHLLGTAQSDIVGDVTRQGQQLHVNKASLSPARRQLLEVFQQLNFGRLDSLMVRNGEPILDPHPKVIREHKLDGENGPRPKLSVADFLLKQRVVRLFDFFDKLRDGVIDVLEVKHGLPFRMIITEVPA